MAMEYKDYIEDLSRFLLKREEQSKIMSAVGSLLQGDIKAEDIPYIKEFECIKKFLEEPLNSRGESALKKVFATAIIIANEKGLLPFRLPESAEEIASLIDDALNRLKVAYQQAIGRIDLDEAVDALVDRAEARAIAFVEYALEIGMPVLADKLEKIMYKNPYTAPFAPFVGLALSYVAEPVKNTVCSGIRTIAKGAKNFLHKAIDFVKEKLNPIKNRQTAYS